MRFFILSLFMLLLPGFINNQSKTQDLDFIYTSILQNHPGIYNDLDSSFKSNLEVFYAESKKALLKTSNITQHKNIIENFAKQFNDSDLWVHWHNTQEQDIIDKLKDLQEFQNTKLKENIIWITLPTFDLNEIQQQELK